MKYSIGWSVVIFSALSSLCFVGAEERGDAVAQQLAKGLLETFEDHEVDYKVTKKTTQPGLVVEERGDGSIGRTTGRHTLRVNLELTETVKGKVLPKRTVSERVVIESNGDYTRLDSDKPQASAQTPGAIQRVVVGKGYDPINVYQAYYSKAGIDWLVSMGWTGLSAPGIIGLDGRLAPANVVHRGDNHQVTYKAACGRITLAYETVDEVKRIRSLSISQQRDDVLTVDGLPNKGIKLGDCQRGPGFATLSAGLDAVTLSLDVSYDARGNIERITYDESARAGKEVTTRKTAATIVGRRHVSSDDIANKYLATIPDGTKAAVVNDPIPYVWEGGKLVKDVDQAAVDAANRSVFRNLPGRNLVALAAIGGCGIALYYLLRRRKKGEVT